MKLLRHMLIGALLSALLPVVSVPADQLFRIVNKGTIRWQCVEVVDGKDVWISDHVAQAAAESCALDHQWRFPDREFNALGVERLRVIISPEARAQSYPGDGDSTPAPNVPVLGTPVVTGATSIDVPLTVEWNSSHPPVSYSLEASTTGPSSGFSEIASGADIFDPETGYAHTGLTADTQHWYRVIASDSATPTPFESVYSAVVTATTESGTCSETEVPGSSGNIAVGSTTTSSLEDITYDSAPNASQYRLLLRNTDQNGTVLTGPSNIVDDATVGTTSFAGFFGLAQNTEYAIRVITQNCFGNDGGTDWFIVSTDADPGANNPPTWDSVPNPSCTEGSSCNYDLNQNCNDQDGDTLTFAWAAGSAARPTGVDISSPNITDNGTAADGTTTGLLATCSDGVNPAVESSAFSYQIFASGGGLTVDGDGGFDFTTIQAAANAAACGETIFVRTKTGNNYAAFSTTKNCPSNNRIVIKEAAGQSVVVTGQSTQAGRTAHAHCAHTGWTIGEGFDLVGTNDPDRGDPPGGTPETSVSVTSDDCHWRGHGSNSSPNGIRLADGVSDFVAYGGSMSTVGNAEAADQHDSGNGFVAFGGINGGPTDYEINNFAFLEAGGHAMWQIEGQRVRFINILCRNDFKNFVFMDGGAERGNRCGTFKNMDDLFIHRFASVGTRTAVDTTNTQVFKMNVLDGLAIGGYSLDHTAGAGAISVLSTTGGDGSYSDIYIAHWTFYLIDGEAVGAKNNGGTFHGPVHIKNVILKDVTANPAKAGNSRAIQIYSDPDNWQDELTVECVISDQNYNVYLDGDIRSLTSAEANFPANFSDITIVPPNFVSETVPTSEDPLTALAQADANFLPQAGAALGTGCPLSQINGAVTSSTVTVDDVKWFRPGLPIFLCGEAVTVKSINKGNDTMVLGDTASMTGTPPDPTTMDNEPVSCANNAPIYYGTDDSPNIGAAQ